MLAGQAQVRLHPAYVAGIIDGEGCVSIINIPRHTNGRQTYNLWRLTLAVAVIDKPLVDALKETYGGTVVKLRRYRPQHKQAWKWQVTNKRAVEVLADVFHHLIIKRRQAEIAFAFQITMRDYVMAKGKKGITRVTPETLELRKELKKQIQAANQRKEG